VLPPARLVRAAAKMVHSRRWGNPPAERGKGGRAARRTTTMNAAPSRYRFREFADGFCVEGDDRSPVEVVFRPTALEVSHLGEGGAVARERFGFFNFGKLLEFVARGLMRAWQPHDGWYGARA